MDKKTEKNSNKKRPKLLIVLIAVGGTLLVACIVVLLVANYYISKLNIVVEGATTPVVIVGAADDAGVEDVIYDENYQTDDEVSQEQLDSMQNAIDENISSEIDIYDDGVLNILVIGSDTRVSGQRARSDVMFILSVNKKSKDISIISIMRDIYLLIPDYGYNRINAAYAFGGAELLLDTIELNFKIEIENYVEFDFYSFIEIVDAIGGVTVYVDESDFDSINKIVANANSYLSPEESKGIIDEAGYVNLTGKQALGYCRNRSYADGDFSRTENQREVVTQLCLKVFDLSLTEANDFLCVYLPRITTNMSVLEILSLLAYLPDYKNYEINQLGVPTSDSFTYATINRMSVLSLDFSKNVDAISNAIYGSAAN